MNVLPRRACDRQLNQLLAALPDAVWQRWQPCMEPVDLALGQVLSHAGSAHSAAIFPTTANVSLLYLTRDGASAEVAVVGNEGVIGVPLLMGGNTSLNQAVVQCPGRGYRLCAQALKAEIQHTGPVLSLLLRYTQSLLAQVAQTALCNRYHSIDQQLARRLLLGLDRSPWGDLEMTQERMAQLLGVRRESVTAAALKLQRTAVISYHRGRVAVLDRERLESHTCACYAVAKTAYNRLQPMRLPLSLAA